jgi:NAD(P)-dependent dehydrogenase (short-subunit alcohol dehydrogenase family)
MISLKGHAGLVTGGTRGVGQAIAESLADAGANLILHGLHADSFAEETMARVRARGVKCHLITADLTGPTQEVVPVLFEQAISLESNLDILISNAGTWSEPDFLDITLEQFERIMRLNVSSHFFLVQAFARYWMQKGIPGRVLLTGSINGRLSEPTHAAYDTSKGAIEAMVRSLCVSLAPRGIRVNGIAPGLVRTPLTAVALDQPGVADWMCLHTPNGRVPGAEVCGPAAAFLVSDEAWHIHGQMLLVDGGMSAWQQPDPPPSWTASQEP